MPKFVSDILAKAGLTVDGVVTLNNTATGQTPLANDNSTKLATTAWVRNFVTPYTLPAATTSTLGGVIVGSGIAVDINGVISIDTGGISAIRSEYSLTATAGQTVFTVPGGYTPGLLDIYLNGVHLGPSTYTATNGTTFTLGDAAVVGDLLDVYVFSPLLDGVIISSDQLTEGTTNLFYTNARARAAISGTSGTIVYSNGVIDLATSGATAGSYGSSSAIPTITVDAYGRITSISTTAVSIVTTIAGLSDVALTSVANNDILKYNSSTSKWENVPFQAEADTLDTVTARGNITTNLITVGGITATGTTSTIYAGTGTRLRTEANNLVFERVASSGFMKFYINQTTLSATAKIYLGYNNATLNGVLSNENTSGGLELRTQDIIRQQIFANGNIVIGSSSPVDAGFKLDVVGTTRLGGGMVTIGKSSSAAQSLKVVASRADNSAVMTVTNEADTVTFFSINGFTGLTSLNSGLFVNSSLNITAQDISVKTDTASQSAANLSVKAGSQNFQNRAGGNLLLQGGAAAGTGDGSGGYISFSTTNSNAASSVTNTVTEAARITINKNLLLGTTTDIASSIFTMNSTSKGFLPPRMTAAERAAISSPATGLVVYQTDGTEGLYIKLASGWKALAIV